MFTFKFKNNSDKWTVDSLEGTDEWCRPADGGRQIRNCVALKGAGKLRILSFILNFFTRRMYLLQPCLLEITFIYNN